MTVDTIGRTALFSDNRAHFHAEARRRLACPLNHRRALTERRDEPSGSQRLPTGSVPPCARAAGVRSPRAILIATGHTRAHKGVSARFLTPQRGLRFRHP